MNAGRTNADAGCAEADAGCPNEDVRGTTRGVRMWTRGIGMRRTRTQGTSAETRIRGVCRWRTKKVSINVETMPCRYPL